MKRYEGVVKSVKDFGCFVEIVPEPLERYTFLNLLGKKQQNECCV